MYQILATLDSIPSETYIVNEQAEAQELAMELRAHQYTVAVSEMLPDDEDCK